MQILEPAPGVLFADYPGATSNVSFIETSAGMIAIDTSTTPIDMQLALDAAEIAAADVNLVILTHADGDHTGGLSLFNCPVLAHELTFERITKHKITDKQVAADQHQLTFGEVRIELTHTGGHKPDSIVIWLPEEKVLFASDNLFQGRYPFMMSSNVPDWIKTLQSFADYPADAIIPGHGTLCGMTEVNQLLDYMQTTWALVKSHAEQGHTLKKTLAGENYPRPEDWIREQLAEKNIEVMYQQATS